MAWEFSLYVTKPFPLSTEFSEEIKHRSSGAPSPKHAGGPLNLGAAQGGSETLENVAILACAACALARAARLGRRV